MNNIEMNNIEAQNKADSRTSSSSSIRFSISFIIFSAIIIVLFLVILILNSTILYNNKVLKSIVENFIQTNKQKSYKPFLQQLKSKCGKTFYKPNPIDQGAKSLHSRTKRVINGREAVPHSWPWVVGIVDEDEDHFCGGALVHQYYVLTAAHCVDDKSPSQIFIKAGKHNITTKGDLLKVRKIFVHEDYDNETLMNDIALLRLVYPVNVTKEVSFICLPDYELHDVSFVGKSAVVAGWGSLGYVHDDYDAQKSGNEYPEVLQETNVVIREDEKCDSAEFNIDVEYCAFSRDSLNHSNICSGDSGAPMYIQINGLWTVIGVVSSSVEKDVNGVEVCDSSSAAYFAKVHVYLDWILQKIMKI